MRVVGSLITDPVGEDVWLVVSVIHEPAIICAAISDKCS